MNGVNGVNGVIMLRSQTYELLRTCKKNTLSVAPSLDFGNSGLSHIGCSDFDGEDEE